MEASPSWLWAVFTITAAGAQTLRNAMQRDLIDTVGAVGATYVRFLFGLPFALVFLALASISTGLPPNPLNAVALAWAGLGGMSQILATGLMLAAMRERSFVATIAYTKTEPIQVALFGLIALGDRITCALALAILVASAGVILLSWLARAAKALAASEILEWRPALFGLGAAACFALSAVGFRAGIRAIGGPTFPIAASTILVVSLCVQSTAIVLHLAIFDRRLLRSLLSAWRPSLFAGFMGALASQFWFLAFAIESAARVRTLGLVEVIFAQIVTRKMFKQATSPREFLGIAMIVASVALLLGA